MFVRANTLCIKVWAVVIKPFKFELGCPHFIEISWFCRNNYFFYPLNYSYYLNFKCKVISFVSDDFNCPLQLLDSFDYLISSPQTFYLYRGEEQRDSCKSVYCYAPHQQPPVY
jgi:hypothetical protein